MSHAAHLELTRARHADLGAWSRGGQAQKLFHTSAMDRVKIVKLGVPARYVDVLTASMGISKEKLYAMIGLARATIDRKVRSDQRLNQDESERVLGVARLIGQTQSIVQESGSAEKFNSAKWLGSWLARPLPALAGKCPGEFMDTADGRSLVADLLAQQQSGAYA
jgi:putative toxin-antitoxin system antitoxin component (TIGR02293 family)